MMVGLGTGGVAVGMFHLITHAFFKSLLFLGAGSVIHGCHEEQNIRRMGGLRRLMPITFATYAVGMLALCGFPLFFSGFWSKDAILHAASIWNVSRMPFYLGTVGVLLTAFYMTRQVYYVFFGKPREVEIIEHASHSAETAIVTNPHESPAIMTIPLVILAACSMLLGLIGTPAWPWFASFSLCTGCREDYPEDPSLIMLRRRSSSSRPRPRLVGLWRQAYRSADSSRLWKISSALFNVHATVLSTNSTKSHRHPFQYVVFARVRLA
jgi:NADH-quinone oxidoreductase subunit L